MAITKIGTTGISNNLDVPGYLYLSGDNKELRFYNGANYMILKASGSLSNNYTITLPVDDGTSGQFLKTDGGGVLSWDAAGGDLSFGGDTFGADKVIGSNDAYSLSFETAGVVRMKIHGPVTSPTSAGAITMPTQPAFLAGNSSADNSATGDGTTFTVEFDAEVFDQGGDYNNSTDTFTAPVTGRYCLNATVLLNSIAANHTEIRMQIVTSNRKYECRMGNDTAKPLNMSLSVLADMDAGVDSATVTVRVSNGSNNVEIYGAGGAYETQFGGFLVA